MIIQNKTYEHKRHRPAPALGPFVAMTLGVSLFHLCTIVHIGLHPDLHHYPLSLALLAPQLSQLYSFCSWLYPEITKLLMHCLYWKYLATFLAGCLAGAGVLKVFKVLHIKHLLVFLLAQWKREEVLNSSSHFIMLKDFYNDININKCRKAIQYS